MHAGRWLRSLVWLPLAMTTWLPAQDRPAPPALSRELAEVVAAYAAKITASAVFLSGRTVDSVLAEELAAEGPLETLVRPLLRLEVDREQRTATARLGPATATAVATPNLGCTLARPDVPVALLQRRAAPAAAAPTAPRQAIDWPLGERLPAAPAADVDHAALGAALDAACTDRAKGPPWRTRAVVVLHRGQLVAERYAPGYHAEQPLPGWSMTKTLVHALLGIRVAQGALAPEAAVGAPEWQAPDDPRRALRLGDLLAMTSGLGWREDYADPRSDALQMLFASSDHAARAAQAALDAPPGTVYRYSSGTTNLLCRALRRSFASDAEHWAFPREALFAPLGMHAAVLETDPSGTFVGSSYGFLTARDWARLGLLYAQDGTFAGRRLLPVGWVAAASRGSAASRGRFGQHLWCNTDPDGPGPAARPWPDLPADTVHMDGHEGQYVVVVPSAALVVVRLGCTKRGSFDIRGLVRRALAACTPAPAAK